MKYLIFRSTGFSLISTMIALVITGTFMSVLFSLMIDHEKGARIFRQKMASLSLKASLIKTMTNHETCFCHFDANTNTDLPSGEDLKIDTTSTSTGEIDLGSIRETCDFASSENEMIRASTLVKGESALMVKDIKIADIVPSGSPDRYLGNLVVEYDNTPGYPVLEPISIPLIFIIDSDSGDESSRPVKACWNAPEVIPDEGLPCVTTDKSDSGEEGRTLVGCGGTSDIAVGQTTAFGFEAGLQTGGQSTYMGYRAGKNHSGTQSTFMGYEAGMNAGESSSSTAVGYQTGRVATGSYQVFLGYQAGLNTTTGSDNVFIGNQAGKDNDTGSRNVAMGSIAASSHNMGDDNVFLGLGSGTLSSDGNEKNVFIGLSAGRNYPGSNSVILGTVAGHHATGDENIFIGHRTGRRNLNGSKNIFIGNFSGENNAGGNDNVFLGHYVSKNNKGDQNVYLGCKASPTASGENTSYNTVVGAKAAEKFREGEKNVFVGGSAGKLHVRGNGNTFVGQDVAPQLTEANNSIFIGRGAGARETSANSKFFVGVDSPSTESTWLSGDISTTGNLFINGQQVSLMSSRVLKKNIQPVKDLKKYFRYLLETPLFTYQYKSKEDHPEKIRMGVVSEELPARLQIKPKGKLSHPDWPSIYGVFWAGIQSLHEMLVLLKESILSEINSLKKRIQEYGSKKLMSLTHLSTIQRQTQEMKDLLKQSSRELKEMKLEFLLLQQDLENKSSELKMRIKDG